jgi:hypothetical protein
MKDNRFHFIVQRSSFIISLPPCLSRLTFFRMPGAASERRRAAFIRTLKDFASGKSDFFKISRPFARARRDQI